MVAISNNITYRVYAWNDKQYKIFKRWQAYIKLPSDKPIRKNFTGGVEAQAAAWRFVLDIVDRYNYGESFDTLNKLEITFREWVEEYEGKYISAGSQARGVISAKKTIINHLLDYFGNLGLKNITANTIAAYFNKRKEQVSEKTIRNEISILKKFLKRAVSYKYIEKNPYDIFKETFLEDLQTKEIPDVQRKPIENINDIFRAVWNDKELRDFCLFFFYTGLRNADILRLKKNNITQMNGRYFISIQENKTNKNLLIPVHKSLFDNGVISLISKSDYLYSYRFTRDPIETAVSEIGKRFKECLKKNNLDTSITLYCFRHTFNHTLKLNRVEESVRRRLFGKLSSGSLRHYEHDDLSAMIEAIDTLPEMNSFTVLSQCHKKADFELHSNPALIN
ncbi:tyrosine-type recombinase/integrase [Candidatus Dependentiae bacterium]|nr:tyrosine-type recombinase/integrase [Candidatus Dependentiae bacterium]